MSIETIQTIIDEQKLEDLRKLLKVSGINLDLWTGEKGTKTVENLYKEVEDGETELHIDEKTGVSRVVHVVAGDIYYRDNTTGRFYRLKEDRQVSKVDGNIKRRPELHGAVAEKMKVGEDPAEATARGIEEELGLTGDFKFSKEEIIEETRLTATYPGLNSTYKIHKVPIEIDKANYNPAGYVEEQPKKTSYFIWEEVIG